MRPDDGARFRVKLPDGATEVSEVNRSACDGWGRRDITCGGRHPFEREAVDVIARDAVLEGLITGVRGILANHRPIVWNRWDMFHRVIVRLNARLPFLAPVLPVVTGERARDARHRSEQHHGKQQPLNAETRFVHCILQNGTLYTKTRLAGPSRCKPSARSSQDGRADARLVSGRRWRPISAAVTSAYFKPPPVLKRTTRPSGFRNPVEIK